MLTYIAAFIFYTMAMVGILLIGFVIYKKTFTQNNSEHKGTMKVLDSISIAPKKMLLVVKVKNEKFLIATDADRTTFLAKLEDETEAKAPEIKKESSEISKEIQYKETQQARLDKIQQQFRDLYSNDEQENKPDRKEMIRKLLKDLNDTQAI